MSIDMAAALTSEWQQRLGLESWRIDVVAGKLDDPLSRAEIGKSRDYDRATLHIAEWMLKGESLPQTCFEHTKIVARDIEEAIVHELLHLVTRDMERVAFDVIDGQLHRDVDIVFARAFTRAQEHAVDALAVALVRAWEARP
jgi:hypothetical protein